jgi:hypothetical protein
MVYVIIIAVAAFVFGIVVGIIKEQNPDKISDSSLRDALKREWQRKLDGSANEWE